jgi:hypothetical protein
MLISYNSMVNINTRYLTLVKIKELSLYNIIN